LRRRRDRELDPLRKARRIYTWAGAFLFLLLAGTAGVAAALDAAGAMDGTIHSFYAALRAYYRVPETEIAGMRNSGISYEELPVVFFIAERARAEMQRVIELRLTNRTWTEIAFRFGLTPDIFYVPLAAIPTSSPYSRPYGRYNSRPKREWKTVRLTDGDVVNLVNLKFISQSSGIPPEQVIRMRSEGKTFPEINEEIEKARQVPR
jgi:hypothetical protein